MDIAWSYIMDQAPMMSNPWEYRETMWAIFNGQDPPPKTPATTATGKRKSLPAGRGMSSSDKRALDEHMANIAAIQAKRVAKN